MTPKHYPSLQFYNRFLLLVAGLGGLLYGIDVGIIAGALPYLEATSDLSRGQLSIVVAAVLLGSVVSTMFAGLLAEWMGRRLLMALSGVAFVISIPVIALADGYTPLVLGRLLQGVSGGLVGVVVPLYLAECLSAEHRGKGTAMFQWMLTLGIVLAAVTGLYFSHRVEAVAALGDAEALFQFKDHAWRSIFWVSLPPGVLFVIGSLIVAESPRWLYRRGDIVKAKAALLRSRTEQDATVELQEMDRTIEEERGSSDLGKKAKESLLKRKYVVPFLLACIILACNQLTGINSIIGYNTTILLQSGLSDVAAHWGYVILTIVNFVFTIVAVALVDKKGRKFLLSLGSSGIVVSLLALAFLFHRTESQRVDVNAAVAVEVTEENTLSIHYDDETAKALLQTKDRSIEGPSTLVVIYSYGDFSAATNAVRSDSLLHSELNISREACVPQNGVIAFFSNPFGNLEEAKTAPLVIESALITPVPSATNGWITAMFIFVFMAFFAAGPGVCVWLALSELMPTRIRSNGMSIALLINQAVSTTIAAVFLPVVGTFGYSTLFLFFAGCSVVYFITATFFLPETKGKTLEEIEESFDADRKKK